MKFWFNSVLGIARQGKTLVTNTLIPGVPNSLRDQFHKKTCDQPINNNDKRRKARRQANKSDGKGPVAETNFGVAIISTKPIEDGYADSVEQQAIGQGHISQWQAGWDVTNAIQGMSLVSLPYAVLHGGYSGLFSIILVAYICCHTSKILVDCLYERDEKTGQIVRVRESYVEIAQVCFGQRFGGKIINAAQVIELLMTCILYVVLCGDLLIGTFPDGSIDMRTWIMLCTIPLIPCALLKNLHSIDYWYWDQMTFNLDPATFPTCLGIVVFSYTSQIFLPSLEGDMKRPARFDAMIDWSHAAAGLCKLAFAYVGFLTFGDATQEVITNNLPTHGLKELVNLTLVVKALLSYPLPYYAAAHLLEISFFKRKPTEAEPKGEGPQPFTSMWTQDGQYRVWAIALRALLVILTMFAAILIPHFALLLGFIGSFTGTMLSFVWPCYFHMYLRWHELDKRTIAWEIFIILLGVFFGITGMYSSFTGLLEVVDFGMIESSR